MRKEIIKNCVDKSWASFLWILALSSVCNRSIFSLQPDSGEKLFRDLSNCVIHPRGESITAQPNINILFCRSGITRLHKRNNNNKFQANDFVRIIPVDAGCKRKKNPVSIETKSKFTKKVTKENTTDTVPNTVKLPLLKNRNTKIEEKISIHLKLQPFTSTSLKGFKQNERHNLDSDGILMKEKIFGKESKTLFPNFKSVNNV